MRKTIISTLTLSCVAMLMAGLATAGTVKPSSDDEDELAPTGKDDKIKDQAGKPKRTVASGINYHGGPLILGTTNIYYIWYGNWGTNTAIPILTDLANSIGGSSYFNINTTYYDGNNTHISNSARYVNSATDTGSYGKSLSDSQIQAVVTNAI